jgi:hypothetical protein
MPVPLDEFPVHQVPLSMEYVAAGDRNFYDRCYFGGHDRSGDVFFLTGLGVYPNLGVKDAYATIRRGDDQWSVRYSDALDEDRLHPHVGGYRIAVEEPLQRIHLECGGDDLEFDLTWEGAFPATHEGHHFSRNGRRATIDASRFAQVGSWRGAIWVAGEELLVDPATWVGVRDRSWGLRPIGEPEPPGRFAGTFQGFWWVYVQLRFDDFAVLVQVQEDPDGHRTHNDAVRVWGDGRCEQLGWPELDIDYRSGTRHPEHATLHLGPRRAPVTIEIDTMLAISLQIGAGYGSARDWKHGQWKGDAWSECVRYDHTDPDLRKRFYAGNVDHSCRAVCDGAEGWGLFEHASVGRHDPSGFADFRAVAP